MDRRGWLWKKKSSHKTVNVTESTGVSSANSEDTSKKLPIFVQVSQERYDHLSALEDHIKVLNEKLSTALSEITNKENLVKQHAKVAEEAVTGWEQAESEVSALKTQLESVTLLKLTAEERISQLDGALKECVKQIRTVKEEGEQKLHDVVFANNKQWEKVKHELESRIGTYEQELHHCSSENERLSGSLDERSNMLMKINEDKCRADAEIETLKTNIQSCEREISSLKYEVHIVSKELEIRTEEKNMSMRSAEVSNKQHIEDVKKIAKLESECQRLRSLVRKKLPGPAAVAQMKLEVDGFTKDYRDSRVPRSPARNSSPRLSSASEFALENMHHCQKENEFLNARLLEMEEETKMLKEALSKRNNELQVSRNMFSKVASKLRAIEEHGDVGQPKYQMQSSMHINDDTYRPHGCNEHEITSMCEDGVDEDLNCSDKWSMMLITDNLSSRKEKPTDKISIISCSSHMELMDDFLEMEKLACSSMESSGAVSIVEDVKGANTIVGTGSGPQFCPPDRANGHEQAESLELTSLKMRSAALLKRENKSEPNKVSVPQIMSKLAILIESFSNENENSEKLLTAIRSMVLDVEAELGQNHKNYIVKEVEPVEASCDNISYQEASRGNSDLGVSADKSMKNEYLKEALHKIQDFVLWFRKEYIETQCLQSVSQGLRQSMKDFTCYAHMIHSENIDLQRFIMALSRVLSETKKLHSHVLHEKDIEGDCNNSECVDKVTLLENKVVQQEPSNNGCIISSSNHTASPASCSSGLDQDLPEDFEQMKRERCKLILDLDRITGNLDQTKRKLLEKEQELSELQSQLAVSQNSNSLSETQLKCMVESYKLIEYRCQEMQIEINTLNKKTVSLENELKEERLAHENDLNKLKHLHDQLERNEQFAVSEAVETKENQEREIVAAAEKLAECQETIFLLGKQLKALHPQAEVVCSPSQKDQLAGSVMDDLSTISSRPEGSPHISQRSGHSETENVASILQKTGGESPFCSSNLSQCDSERNSSMQSPTNAKRPKHRQTLSSSSSSSLTVNGQKQGRGFSRFFSKGK